jgi:hypothetical protein
MRAHKVDQSFKMIAYARGVVEFLAWCESAGVASIAGVQPGARRDLHRMA